MAKFEITGTAIITHRFNDKDLASEWKKDANWQVVFRVQHDGKVMDYCRETRLRCIETIEEVEAWARAECVKHRLCGAEIQLW
jgi:ABC-type Fe3+-citrate transport system substrate-binding protein